MMSAPSTTSRINLDRCTALVVLALLALGLALRLIGLGREGLWIDEIFSASYTNLSFFDTIVACLRFDLHPPLYYLQLDAWSAFGHGDTWLMLNSVGWSMATLVLVYLGATRYYGALSGKLSLAFCAVMGSEVYFANELRMYALFAFLMTLSWILANRVLADYRLRTAIPLILVLVAVGALHSFGVVAVAGALLYLFPPGTRQEFRRRFPVWVAVSAIAGVTLLPWMISAFVRHPGHLEPLTAATVVYTISGWLLGYRALVLPEWLQIGVTLLLALSVVIAIRLEPTLRRTILCYLLWPLAVAAVICLLGKPVWLFRSFSFCAPLLSICLGTLFSRLISAGSAPRLMQRTAIAIAVAAIGGAAALASVTATTPWKTQYREAAAYLRENVQTGDIVYIPNQVTYWGIARYLVGPRWGSLLEVQDPVDPDKSRLWPGIYRRLGPRILERLHLIPRTRRTDGFRAPLYIGWSPLPEAKNARVIWLVGSVHPPFEEFHLSEVQLCRYEKVRTADFTELRVFRVTCTSST